MEPAWIRIFRRLRALSDTPWLLAMLAVLTLCYPLGAPALWLMVVVLVALCCVGSLPSLAAAYVFLFLFDNMLPFPALGGSLARVLQAGIALRAALLLIKARAKPDRFMLFAALFTAVACAISFIIKGLVGDSLSFAINMLVLLALRAALRTDNQASGLFQRLTRVYVASAVTAVVFGVVYNRFFVVGAAMVIRFLGTHEPNFMAMFLNVAVILWLMLPRPNVRPAFLWPLDAVTLGVLLGGLVMTGSLTGFAIAGCMLLICGAGACRGRNLKLFALRLFCGGLVAAVVVIGGQHSTLLRPQHERDIYNLRTSTGSADADTPIYIAEETYRTLRAAGEPVEPHLLTAAQWRAYREEHGIERMAPRPRDVEHLLQDGFAQTLRRVPILGNRLYTALGYARLYGLDVATSGRWGLITEKLRDFAAQPAWQKLLGRGPDPEITYFPMFQTFGYSHNSYLDMLTGFGAIGLGLLLWWFVRTARRGQFLGLPVEQECHQALTLARIALLLHAATLTMHLNRVFLFFFMG
ncbi:MAG: hypothetical protein FWD25_01900 [Clostridia bacterium]|nr:hypothetical protein [Clostridia bacterium]